MGDYTQANRMIRVETVLGKDALLLQGFRGQEGISRMFHFDLNMHSENRSIQMDSIVGKKATVVVVLPDQKERYINGVISSFSQAGSTPLEMGTNPKIFAHYSATLVPWMWMLTRTSDCRIFQDMTVPDIIAKIFQEHKLDFSNRLHGAFKPREYCVQYRETDFNFVSRLMEEEGIFYFFDHEADQHTLVLADDPDEFKLTPLQTDVSYKSLIGAERHEDVITEWTVGQDVRPGRYAINDFNFKQPLLDLTSGVGGKDERKLEIYDYPGAYSTRDEGDSPNPTVVVFGWWELQLFHDPVNVHFDGALRHRKPTSDPGVRPAGKYDSGCDAAGWTGRSYPRRPRSGTGRPSVSPCQC